MLRRLFTFASVISLIMCIATVVLWVRSYRQLDSMELLSGYRAYLVECSAGQITVLLCSKGPWQSPFAMPGHPEFRLSNHVQMIDYTGEIPSRLGFGHRNLYIVLERGDTVPMVTISLFRFPYPLLMMIFLLTPAWWCAGRIYRSPQATMCHCIVCGYDLRATPDRCPECGTPIASARTPA